MMGFVVKYQPSLRVVVKRLAPGSKMAGQPGLALLPSKVRPDVDRWHKVVSDVDRKPPDKQLEEALPKKEHTELHPVTERHVKNHGSELETTVGHGDVNDAKAFEENERSKLQQMGWNELRNHRNMLKLVGFAMASSIPPLGNKLKQLREEQLDKHRMTKEEAAVASGYLAQYAWSMLPFPAGYSAAVKAGMKIGLAKAGIAGAAAGVIGGAASLAVGSLIIWKGISWAIRKNMAEKIDHDVFRHLESAQMLIGDGKEKLESLTTFTGKSENAPFVSQSGLDKHDIAKVAHHTAIVVQPILHDALQYIVDMFKSGDIPDDLQEQLGEAVKKHSKGEQG